MSPRSSSAKKLAEQVVKDIRRATRRHFSADDKIRIMLDGSRGEDSIAELCRKEGVGRCRGEPCRRWISVLNFVSWPVARGQCPALLHSAETGVLAYRPREDPMIFLAL